MLKYVRDGRSERGVMCKMSYLLEQHNQDNRDHTGYSEQASHSSQELIQKAMLKYVRDGRRERGYVKGFIPVTFLSHQLKVKRR
jgi:hypothetical protein